MPSVTRFSASLVLVACTPEPQDEVLVPEVEVEVVDQDEVPLEKPLCEADGDLVLELGTGGLSGFTPFVDGGTVPLELDPSGSWGLYLDLLSTGLDSSEPVAAMLRFTVGDDPTTQDAGGMLALQCPHGGPGWAGVFAALDDPLQDDDVIPELDGLPLHLTGLLTDRNGETASTELTLRIGVP